MEKKELLQGLFELLMDGECKRAPSEVTGNPSPVKLGNSAFIRTVTHYYTGKIIFISKDEIVLSDAAWIADTGRFNNALVKADLNEVEPYPSVVSINRGAIIDVSEWHHILPKDVK